MPSFAADIDPFKNLEAPKYLERNIQTREETIFEKITDNGYRIRLIASAPQPFTKVGFIGGRYQFMQDISENDPRAINPAAPGQPELEPEEQVFNPRLIEIKGEWFDETSSQIPLRVMLVVTKVKDFEKLQEAHHNNQLADPQKYALKNGLGNHEVLFHKFSPDYYREDGGRSVAIQANHLGYPIAGHNEKFHLVETPFLTPTFRGYTASYGKFAVLNDVCANLANVLETLKKDEYLTGISVIQTGGVATLPSGARKIDSIDLFLQTERVRKKTIDGKTQKIAIPYTAAESQQQYLRDEYGQPLYRPDVRTIPGSSKSVDLGLYEIMRTPRWKKWVDFYQSENEEAAYGVPTHALSGTGKEREIVANPQYIGEPVNIHVGQWNKKLGLTHSQQMRNYMMVLANSRRMSPTGVDIFLTQEERPDGRDSLTSSKLAATNPGSNPGAHFPDLPSNVGVAARSALFRYKLKDTKAAVRERDLWATKVKRVTHRDFKGTFVATTHMLRSDSNMFGVVSPVTGDVLIDLNFARPHIITEDTIHSSALHNFGLASTLAAVLGYWMDRGTVFGSQRVVTSATESGGLPLGSIAGDEFTRNFIEVEGVSNDIRDGKVHVSPTYRMQIGDYSDKHRRALYAIGYRGTGDKEVEKYKKEHGKLPDNAMPDLEGTFIEYNLKPTWVEALNAFVPLWQVNESYGHRNATVAAIMRRMSNYINQPMFYGDVIKDKPGGKRFQGDDVPTVRGKDGKPVKVKSHAVGFFFHMTAEDYERAGVWMKREMRMEELNMRIILKLIGHDVDRKESGHEWQGEGEYMAIDGLGNYDENATEVSKTDRQETTFQFVNRFISSFKYPLWKFYQERFFQNKQKYVDSPVGAIPVDTIPSAGNNVNRNTSLDLNTAIIDQDRPSLDAEEEAKAYFARQREVANLNWSLTECYEILGQEVDNLAELKKVKDEKLASDIPFVQTADVHRAYDIVETHIYSLIRAATSWEEKQRLKGHQ